MNWPQRRGARMTSYSQGPSGTISCTTTDKAASGMWRMENQNVVMQQKVGLTEIPLL